MLSAIWWGSWLLCAVALGALVILIVVRAYRRRLALRDRVVSRTLAHDIIVWLSHSAHDMSALRDMAHRRPAFVEQLLFRTAELVQGDERNRLIALADELGLQQRLIHTVQHGRTSRRRQAAETLAMFDTPQAVTALQAALNDKQIGVRLAAARSLATQAHAVPLGLVANDPAWFGDSTLIQDVFNRLADHQHEDLADLIVDDTVTTRVRALAIKALANTGRYDYLPVFLGLAVAQQATLREAAAYALGALEHPRGVPALLCLVDDDEPTVRAAAMDAAARIESPEFIPNLERALSDENWWVRSRAADALAALGAAGSAVLSRVAQGPASRARDAAALNVSVEAGLQ